MNTNRLAALSGVLTAVAGVVVTLLGAVDSTSKAIVTSVGLVVIGAVLIVWLLGWQKHEARVVDSMPQVAPPPGEAEIEGLTEGVRAEGPLEGTNG